MSATVSTPVTGVSPILEKAGWLGVRSYRREIVGSAVTIVACAAWLSRPASAAISWSGSKEIDAHRKCKATLQRRLRLPLGR
jgi:hypothetical protein